MYGIYQREKELKRRTKSKLLERMSENVNGVSEQDFRVLQGKLTDLNYDGQEYTKQNTSRSTKKPRVRE